MNQLEDLLAAKKWKEADAETANIIFTIANREGSHGYLSSKEWRDFPCQELKAIDQLWMDHSKGHFGFAVQKAIYQSLGVTEKYEPVTWKRFGTALGWYGGDRKATSVYSLKAPRGCLPVLGRLVETGASDDWGDITRYYGWNATIQSEWYSESTGWHTTREDMSEAHRRFSAFVSKLADCHIST